MSEPSSDAIPSPGTLALRNVSAGYGASLVLDDVTCEFGGQDVVGILGPNGSGKSTLLKTSWGYAAILRQIEWLAAPPTLPTPSRSAAVWYVPQVDTLSLPTVEENLNVGGYVRPRREPRSAMDEVFEIFRRAPTLRMHRKPAAANDHARIGMALIMKPKCLSSTIRAPTRHRPPLWLFALLEVLLDLMAPVLVERTCASRSTSHIALSCSRSVTFATACIADVA